MRSPIVLSALILVLLSCDASAQSLELSWKRIGGFHSYKRYQNRYFLDLTHLSLERRFGDSRFSMGVDLIYSHYLPVLPEYYKDYVNPKNYHDRTFAYGFYGRYYLGDQSHFKMFFQAAAYGNHLHVLQPIAIPHAYGVYTTTIDYRDFLISGAVATGFEFDLGQVYYEPYIQLGFSQMPEQRRGDHVIVGSVGQLAYDRSAAFIVVPLSLKVKIR